VENAQNAQSAQADAPFQASTETIAQFECITGWAVLQRKGRALVARVWSKDNGADQQTFTNNQAREATDKYEGFCRQLIREMRP
jgi:hypothetical protein